MPWTLNTEQVRQGLAAALCSLERLMEETRSSLGQYNESRQVALQECAGRLQQARGRLQDALPLASPAFLLAKQAAEQAAQHAAQLLDTVVSARARARPRD